VKAGGRKGLPPSPVQTNPHEIGGSPRCQPQSHDAIAARLVHSVAPLRRIRVRQVIIAVIAAAVIGYDFFMLNGYYTRLVIAEASSIWNSIESFVLGLF
jgi:hypothetical protein